MIHVLNFEDKIIDYISKRDSSIVTAEHSHNIEEDTETFELTLHSDKAENLRRRVKLVVEMLDGTYREFFVSEIEDNVVEKETTLTCVASYLEDLSKAKPIPPQKITKQTLIEMLDFGLRGTGWDRGNVDYMGEKSRSWTAYATPYEYLKMLRTTFGHEYRFVIEIEGRKVKRRRVDCVKPEPLFNGREIVYGKDLLGMTRSIDMSEVVTAYIGLGPEKDNGEREVVEVVDDEVQESFDLPENYLWGIYEPESEDQDMTKERLTTLTRTALNKAKSRVFSYEVTSLDVKKQFGHELVQIGDIVRIKNRDFKPPIYADGRIIEITSDLMAERQTYKLGEIKEYDENKLRAYFNSIKSLLTKKVNDDINNMNTIIIDNIQDLEIFERNISKGAEPPLNPVENQLWYDTSNPEVAILREYVNGQWINATAEDVRDIGGFTREQTIYNDLDNTMDNLLAQHTQLQTLYDNLYNSEYLVDDVLKQDYKAKYDDLNAQFLIAKNLFDSLDLEHATIGKLMDVQAAIVEYRNKLQAFYLISQRVDKSISERIKLLQSQYTDEKYNEAMEKVASSINGTWNAETGQLIADVPNEARLTELRQQIESTYDQELNSAMATLRNETDSKLVNTKNEISATVAKVDEKITGLTIGGRNLFQSYNSNFSTSINKDIVSTQSFTGRYWATNLYRPDFLKTVLKAGETYTYSYEIEIIGLSEKEVPAVKKHGVIFYSATDTKNNILSYVDLEREVGNKYKVSTTFVAPEITDHRFIAYSGFYSDDGTIQYPTSSNLVKISNLKLEKGNKATDWTPAPEDTTNKIATAQANAEAAAKAYADAQDALRKTEAQAYADGIVTAEEERAINDAKAKLQEAKTYAEQQKQIAIDTANDNTTSALEPITVKTTNNEQSIKALEEQILLTATKEEVTQQLDSELAPIKTDVNDQKAQLSVMSDEISSKVSMNQYSLDQKNIVEKLNRAETERTQLSNQINDRVTITEYNSGMSQKTNEINTAVNNIKIGGVNMLDGTKDFTSPFNTPNIQKYGEVINGELTSVDFDSVNNRLMWATFYTNIPVQPNTDYTISYDAKTKDGIAQGVVYTPITRLQDDGTDFNPRQYLATAQTYKNTTNEFQRYSFTFNTGASKRIKLTFTSKDVNSLTNIKKVKLELGNKATDYTESPTDIARDTDKKLTVAKTEILQDGEQIAQRVSREVFNASSQTLNRVVSEFVNNTSDGMTFRYDENGNIQSHSIGPQGVKIKGDKVDIKLNKEFNLLVGDVSKKADETNIINKINLSREGLDINVNNIGLRGGDSVNYLEIKNNSVLSRGRFTRTWANNTDTANLTLGIRNGYLLVSNEDNGYNLYMTEKGLSTMMNAASGETAGTLEFHYQGYNENSRGVRLHSTYGAVALESDQSRIYTVANLTNNIESRQYGVYIRPFKDTRTGLNEFYFYVKDNDSVSDTDGVILYGNISDERGEHGSGIRFSKSRTDNIVYITNRNGDIGTGDISVRNAEIREHIRTQGMLEIRQWNDARAYNQVKVGAVNTTNSVVMASHSGGNAYYGVGTQEMRVTDNNGYNGGNTRYKSVRADTFYGKTASNSSEKYKTNITKWEVDATQLIKDTVFYEYNYKSDLQNGNEQKSHGIIIEREMPKFITRDNDSIDLYEFISTIGKALQEQIKRSDELEFKYENIMRVLEEYTNERTS